MAVASAYQVAISGSPALSSSGRALLRRAVKTALRVHGVVQARIGLRLVSDEEMAMMNQKHVGHEGSTDVLTFDLGVEEASPSLEGDIAISVDTARREGENLGHSVEAELALYAVHGVLHLLDYRDDESHSAVKMHEMEDQILKSLGLGAVYSNSGP